MRSDAQDDFIGRTFGENNQVSVTGRETTPSGGQLYYTVKCSVCAEDPEMFGDGVFRSIKGNLLKGFIPCGCKQNFSRTAEQMKLAIDRFCVDNDKPYKFKGFAQEYSGKDTKLKMHCNLCDKEWSTTTCNSFFQGTGCSHCRGDRISASLKKDDNDIVESFRATGRFHENAIFTRSDRKTRSGSPSYWHMECPVCKEDEYTKAGLCSGVFEAFSGSFQQGRLPCRCSKAFYYTKEQREWFITKTLVAEDKGVKFLRWVGEYNGGHSKFELECNEHGRFTRSVLSFVAAKNYGCPSCAKFGFKVSQPATLYVFRAVSQNDAFTGYGITNSSDTRLRRHNTTLTRAGFGANRLRTFDLTGHDALSIESLIKLRFPLHSQAIEGFKTEATYAYLYKYVIYFIEEEIEKRANESEDNDLYRGVLRVPSPGEVHVRH